MIPGPTICYMERSYIGVEREALDVSAESPTRRRTSDKSCISIHQALSAFTYITGKSRTIRVDAYISSQSLILDK